MSALLALLSATALGQVKLDSADLTKDLVLAGKAKASAASINLNGGTAKLKPTRQQAISAAVAKPFSVKLALKGAGNGTAVTVGPLRVSRAGASWKFAAGSGTVTLPAQGAQLRAVAVADGSMLRVFANGRIAGVAPYSGGPSAPLQLGPWAGSVVELEILPRPLMPQDAMAMSQGTQQQSNSAVVEAQLVQLTETPDPKSVLPYRHALITHEYKIVAVKSGSMAGVAPGATVRVARWGIIGGQKTAIAALKKGDKVTINLGRFEDFPALEREFTVDKLPDNLDAPYLVDTVRPGG